MMHIERLVVALLAGCLLAATPEAQAQTRTQTPAQSPWQNTARPAAPAPTQGAQPSSAAPKPQLSVADRAAQIEERLIDLQVRIATMRSLAANGAPAATGTAPLSRFQDAPLPDTQQIAALEGEVRALSEQSSKLSGRPALILPESTNARRPLPDNRTPSGVARVAPPSPTGTAPGWASSTTVSPNNNQGLFAPPSQSGTALQGELLPGTVYPGIAQPPIQAPVPQGGSVAGLANPTPLPGGLRAVPVTDGPETEYQKAYGYLLQQDYGAAQTAFREFIARYPKTPLAGNAQYWLGETHYVRGAYKDAAVAFLKGYEKYGDGNKGPDSLLKLALSLGKLRQNAAACSSLSELGTRFPNAPAGLLARGTAEKRRLRCPA